MRSAASGDVVFTEREDVLWRGDVEARLPICGVFEMRGGKIAGWRDYFDRTAQRAWSDSAVAPMER